MTRLFRRLIDRLSGGPSSPPAPVPVGRFRGPPPHLPVRSARGLPRAFMAVDGPDRPRLFDPAVLHYANALRSGDPAFADPDEGRRWAEARRRTTDHVLRAVAESAWADRLILRGSRLLRAWFGPAAREPGDLDWVVARDTDGSSPTGVPGDRDTDELFDDLTAAVFGGPAPAGVAFDRDNVATDDIWTYERVPGRRAAFPWQADGLPGGAVQIDVTFGEELDEPARRVAIPLADGGCASLRAAGPAQSLAWKILWLSNDWYPQGKDLYDAVLLAERFPLPRSLLEATLRRGEVGPMPESAAELFHAGGWMGWNNFRAERPDASGEAADWQQRLEAALAPTFAGAVPAAPGPAAATVDPAWLTPTVVGLATGIAADAAFDRLPILADALEEAGCDDAETLLHCRRGGPHTCGCAVVDALLGRGW